MIPFLICCHCIWHPKMFLNCIVYIWRHITLYPKPSLIKRSAIPMFENYKIYTYLVQLVDSLSLILLSFFCLSVHCCCCIVCFTRRINFTHRPMSYTADNVSRPLRMTCHRVWVIRWVISSWRDGNNGEYVQENMCIFHLSDDISWGQVFAWHQLQ